MSARKNEAHDIVVDSLAEALVQLMEKKPFSEISISELCQRAGVSRISFYRNYSRMDEILTDYLVRSTDQWWKEFSKNDMNYIFSHFCEELIREYKKNEKLVKLLYQNNLSNIIKEHIFICCDPNEDREEVESYTRSVFAGAIYGMVDEWIRRGMQDLPANFSLHSILTNSAL